MMWHWITYKASQLALLLISHFLLNLNVNSTPADKQFTPYTSYIPIRLDYLGVIRSIQPLGRYTFGIYHTDIIQVRAICRDIHILYSL